MGGVKELRLVLTVPDLDAALHLYRDALGLEQLEAWEEGDARGVLLGAGRATLELFNEGQAELIDRIEAGHRSAGPVRVAFEVEDTAAAVDRLVEAGAETVAAPVVTPWKHRNARLRAPDGMQLTLFTVLDQP
jgi:catechol 2,3-dioxygenase-like lactoylglutathione lyase family enzyme